MTSSLVGPEAFSVNQHASICGGYGPEPAEGTPEWKVWDKKRQGGRTATTDRSLFGYCGKMYKQNKPELLHPPKKEVDD